MTDHWTLIGVGILIVFISAFIGGYLDITSKLKEGATFWAIGIISGLAWGFLVLFTK